MLEQFQLGKQTSLDGSERFAVWYGQLIYLNGLEIHRPSICRTHTLSMCILRSPPFHVTTHAMGSFFVKEKIRKSINLASKWKPLRSGGKSASTFSRRDALTAWTWRRRRRRDPRQRRRRRQRRDPGCWTSRWTVERFRPKHESDFENQ